MTDKPLDLSKPVQTRDGRKVRILCTDAKAEQPIIGLVWEPDNEMEWSGSWNLDGCFYPKAGKSDIDLINAPVKGEGWVVFFADRSCIGELFDTEEIARSRFPHGRFHKTEWEE